MAGVGRRAAGKKQRQLVEDWTTARTIRAIEPILPATGLPEAKDDVVLFRAAKHNNWRSDWPEVGPAKVPKGTPIETRARNTVTSAERTMESKDTGHQHTAEEERRIRESALDKTIADSFPASDPPSSNPNPDDHSAAEHAPPAGTDPKRPNPY